MNKASIGLILTCPVAGIIGYAIAISPMHVGRSDFPIFNTRAKPRAGEAIAHHSNHASQDKSPHNPQQIADLRKDLLQRFEANPATAEDWAFRATIQAILAGLTEEELQELVKDDLVPLEPGKFRSWDPSKLYPMDLAIAQWATMNPENACRSLMGKNDRALQIAFGEWQKRDPEAAQEWLNQTEFPKASEGFKNNLIRGALADQVSTDFSAAKEALSSLDAESQTKALLSWSVLVARDPAKRQEFLAFLASRSDAELTTQCFDSLVKEMARQSPSEAAAFVEASDQPEDRKDQLSHALLGEWALKQPKEAFTAWAELKEGSAPEPLLKAIDEWSINSPGAEDAIEWMKSLDAGPAREQFKTRLINSFRNFGRLGQAADLSASLEDPAESIRQLKLIKRIWQEGRPDQANSWFAKLPEETRKAVDGE